MFPREPDFVFSFLYSFFSPVEAKQGPLWKKVDKVIEYRTRFISVPVSAKVFWISNPFYFPLFPAGRARPAALPITKKGLKK